MRNNPILKTHEHPYNKEIKLSYAEKRFTNAGKLGKGNYATPRAPDVTPPNTYTNPSRAPYRTGDGDYFHAPQRQGADHSHIKSRGFAC